jgi:hypothetical protein
MDAIKTLGISTLLLCITGCAITKEGVTIGSGPDHGGEALIEDHDREKIADPDLHRTQ